MAPANGTGPSVGAPEPAMTNSDPHDSTFARRAPALRERGVSIAQEAHAFPMLGPDEFEALKRDIAEHGQREPILLVDGEVIDGRNRLRACEELGIEPKVRNLSRGEAGDVFALVMSLNFHRRHLKPHEKGAAEAAYLERNGGKRGAAGRPSKGDEMRGVRALSKAIGVPEATIRDHLRAAEDYAAAAPELRAKVDSGEITPKAARVMTERSAQPAKPTEERVERAKRTKPERDILEDCAQAIEEAISTALLAYPSLRAAIAARLRLIEQGVRA